MNKDYLKINQKLWDAKTPVHVTSGFYEMEAFMNDEAYNWNHSMADTLNTLTQAGLDISNFQEYNFSHYDIFGTGIEVKNGYQVKGLEGMMPLVFSVVAKVPANATGHV